MTDDAHLLRQYVETQSEAAFAELVQRHLGLVYRAALRQLRDRGHLADDVAQSVFLLLARKSPALTEHPSLAGWLHTTTQFTVRHALRAERRRQLREDVARTMSELTNQSVEADWEQIRPVLDDVLQDLKASDREAVLLRFFENRAFADIAIHLRLSQRTAHKRVERALMKLRDRLAHRGVTTSAAALATVLGTQGAMAMPPAGLAASVTGAVAASGLPIAATAGWLAFMSTKMTVTVAALTMLLLGGVATEQVWVRREALDSLAALESDTARLRTRLLAEEERIARQRVAASAFTPPQSATGTSKPSTGGGMATSRSAADQRIAEGRTFLKAHPEVRTALIAFQTATLRRTYADLITAMGLSEEQTEQFIAIAMSTRGQIVDDQVFRLADDSFTPAEQTRQLKALLGDSRYQQYRDDNKSESARTLATDLTSALCYTATPLAPAQIDQFKNVVLQTLNDGSLGPRYKSAPWILMPAPVWNEILRRAGGILSAPQVAALADFQQRAMVSQAFGAATKQKP